MLKRLDSVLDRLLLRLERNNLYRRIAKRFLLSHYGRKGLDRLSRFYEAIRFEREADAFRQIYHFQPRLDFPSNPAVDMEIAKKNLSDTKRILDSEGIKFWLIFGTFLGAYRDKAIIPYDKDTDLAIYCEDLPALACCKDTFAKEGFYLGVDPDVATLNRDGEHTDIYFFRSDGSKRIWRSIKYDISAFETFNEIQFLGQNWRILSEPERWLKYTYGEDWRTPIKGKGVSGGHPYGV